MTLPPPAAGPERGAVFSRIVCENSDVLPAGSVAIAVTRPPGASGEGSVKSIATTPEASVVAGAAPTRSSPCVDSTGNETQLVLA